MWLQLHLTVDKTRSALIELLFEQLGAVAVTLGDAGDEPMLEPGPGETPLWQATRVTGLFPGSYDSDVLRSAINRALADDVSRHLTVEPVVERDWERAWLDRFAPMRFGSRLWIRPSGHTVTQPDAVIIDLDPGLAFGTGTHPTTALCLEWLDAHPPIGREVLDFGCGSGVLAIAALKLGAHRAVAVDHDPQALLATADNAERNLVAPALHVQDTAAAPVLADLVLANILANVLIERAAQLTGCVRSGGDLVMSGILDEQCDDVMAAYAADFTFSHPLTREEWVLLHGRRR